MTSNQKTLHYRFKYMEYINRTIIPNLFRESIQKR